MSSRHTVDVRTTGGIKDVYERRPLRTGVNGNEARGGALPVQDAPRRSPADAATPNLRLRIRGFRRRHRTARASRHDARGTDGRHPSCRSGRNVVSTSGSVCPGPGVPLAYALPFLAFFTCPHVLIHAMTSTITLPRRLPFSLPVANVVTYPPTPLG